ncbi:hypothetical protein GCM10010329_61280 [Streptomyces spiroverticillatus]|uniref:Uncharacterized protein n=1 Tax=Streptomyces finlayi TaxID=67296 RepID=A0A918X439_9ACTN|nr:hypothetical protein GCM10010329_61280 [Streptomyces spiroverticillatus]GHD10013.1 hypothetical protein GCM10010334_64940 [Streptomyces finlayi]
MHDDECAVLAQVQVEFDDVHARVLGVQEGAEGVLRLDTHDSAMTDGEERQGDLASVDGGTQLPARTTQPAARDAEPTARLAARLRNGTRLARGTGVFRRGVRDAQQDAGDDGGEKDGAHAHGDGSSYREGE